MVKNYFAEKKHVYRLLAIAMAENGEVAGKNVNEKEVMAIATTLVYRYYSDFDEGNSSSTKEILEAVREHLKGHGIENVNIAKSEVKAYICKLGHELKSFYESRIEREAEEIIQLFCEVCEMCRLLVIQSCNDLEEDSDGTVRKSIFMNVDSLTPKQKRKELKEMVYIIRSDDSVMDREREAFRVVCKIFKMKNSTLLWKKLVEEKMEDLLTDSTLRLNFFLKRQIDVNDFNNVKHSICFYDIKGPIIQGAYHILQRSETRKEDKIYQSDKKWSRMAVIIFGISSLFLYFFVADMVNQVPGHPQILKMPEINEGLKSILNVCADYIFWVTAILIVLKYGLDWIFRNIRSVHWLKRVIGSDFYAAITLLGIIGTALVGVRYGFAQPWDAIVKTFFIPCVLVVMMLSIEWLIFMRQEYSGLAHDKRAKEETKKSNASVLVVLVCAAILTDICLGVVELIAHSKLPEPESNLHQVKYTVETIDYVAKVSSALILGCICFFAGKFLDMYRMQQQTDVYKMTACIEELEKKINKDN